MNADNKIEMLEVYDENGNVLYLEDRKIIHQKGLLHKEVHVYFITPEREIILQRRAKDKDTYPGLLDATVGGHVEAGDTYEDAAIKESLEETGLVLIGQDLIPFGFVNGLTEDLLTGNKNNSLRSQYLYLFKGQVSDLKVEAGKADGFEKMQISEFLKIAGEQTGIFVASMHQQKFIDLFTKGVLKLDISKI